MVTIRAMHDAASISELIIGLLVAVTALVWLAGKLRLPVPIFLVVGGLAIALVPGLPDVVVPPSVVFLLFLPPLLFHAGLMTSWRDFRANIRPISLLAIGLTLITTFTVAAAAHYLMGLPWAAAFVLGAIISPPDAVAATSVLQRLGVPKRMVTILEGESLANDATALVAFAFAIEAMRTGEFSLAHASWQFVLVSVGGIIVGYFVGMVVCWLRKRLNDSGVDMMVSLLTPYMAYLPAEWLKVSGVLSAVVAGLFISRRLPKFVGAQQRMRLIAVWETWTFVLNGVVFILIGLVLPEVVKRLGSEVIYKLMVYVVLLGALMALVRFVWVFAATYASRLIPSVRRNDPIPPKRQLVLISWAGMRGIVSLAAALAIPIYLDDKQTVLFPYRDEIIFVSFGLILLTLVGQGLTLAPIARWMKLSADDDTETRETAIARREMTFAALARLDAVEIIDEAPREMVEEVRQIYQQRVPELDAPEREACVTAREIHLQALEAQKLMLVKLRDDGLISDEVLRKLQHELDLEESRVKAGLF
jgi:monovalent cation/hydrogen antiporter